MLPRFRSVVPQEGVAASGHWTPPPPVAETQDAFRGPRGSCAEGTLGPRDWVAASQALVESRLLVLALLASPHAGPHCGLIVLKAGPATAPHRWPRSLCQGRSQGRVFVLLASACEAQVAICLPAAPLALPLPGRRGVWICWRPGAPAGLVAVRVRLPPWLCFSRAGAAALRRGGRFRSRVPG